MANQWGDGYLINSGAADNMGADVISKIVRIDMAEGVGVEIFVNNTTGASTGTATGTIYVQVSNSGTNWFDVASYAVASGSNKESFGAFDGLNARFLRVFWDRTSGNGIMDVWVYVRR